MEEEKIWQPGKVSTQTHPDGMPLMGLSLSLEASSGKVIKTLREFTYLGRGALSVLVSRVLKGKGLNQVIQ